MTNSVSSGYSPYVAPDPGYIWSGGKQVKYTPPTVQATTDANGRTTWTSTPAAGMTDTADAVNRNTTQQLGADDFMKLLVAQLKYQDPTKPQDTGEMMQQTASMSMVERVNEMASSAETMSQAVQALASSQKDGQAGYASMLMEQRMSSAVSLVGKQIGYVGADDPKTTVSGVVDSVKFDTSGPILVVGGKDVPLASVSSVTAPTAAPSSTGQGKASTA